jgi:large subunit ribosomal protein L10
MPNYTLKAKAVDELSQLANEAMSMVLAEYRDLNAEQLCSLRAESRKQGVVLKVYKNTLAKRALKGTKFECINDALVGPIMLGCSMDAPGAAAKLLQDFAKKNQELKIMGVSLGDQFMGPEHIKRVAALPNREQALSILLGTLQAPVVKLAQGFTQTYAKFGYALVALKDKLS